MLIRILSWNVRGINDKDKRKVVKAFLRIQRADLVCLQETKCKLMLDSVVRSLGFGRFVNWGSVHSRGQAGGILVFWDCRVLQLLEMETWQYSISCRFKNCNDNFIWIFTGVYGPVHYYEREFLWFELGDIKSLWSDPWCVGGDFNVIRLPSEIRNCLNLSSAMRRFSEVIDELQLRDLPLVGGSYTWCGGLNNRLASRLDRFWSQRTGRVTFPTFLKACCRNPFLIMLLFCWMEEELEAEKPLFASKICG